MIAEISLHTAKAAYKIFTIWILIGGVIYAVSTLTSKWSKLKARPLVRLIILTVLLYFCRNIYEPDIPNYLASDYRFANTLNRIAYTAATDYGRKTFFAWWCAGAVSLFLTIKNDNRSQNKEAEPLVRQQKESCLYRSTMVKTEAQRGKLVIVKRIGLGLLWQVIPVFATFSYVTSHFESYDEAIFLLPCGIAPAIAGLVHRSLVVLLSAFMVPWLLLAFVLILR